MNTASLTTRMRRFAVAFGITCAFIYLVLPALTQSVDILQRMSVYLENNGIDPTRYYYTDVEQVKEGELYLREVLE